MITLTNIDSLLVYLSNLIWSEFFLIPALAISGFYLTIGLRAFPLRYLFESIRILLKGRSVKSETIGEIPPIQALTTALSATIGTGNIVGVAAAIQLGGRGAVFWMWVVAILGMATKFSEAVLAVKFRERDSAGHFVGGPMYYIKNGLKPHWAWLGSAFAIFGTIAAFGIGNTVQSNAVSGVLATYFFVAPTLTGVMLSLFAGLVLLGGINRIGKVAERIVPLMAILYLSMSVIVLVICSEKIPAVFASIISEAFAPSSGAGVSIWLAMRWGFARGIFSNEAGLGSAAIAHAAATTESPVEQGMIAMLGPFIDTIVICTMTALVILVAIPVEAEPIGAALSAKAFTVILGPIGGNLVAIAMTIFAFTTILGWSYYGERCAQFLLGRKIITPYRIMWVAAIFFGAITEFKTVWVLADIFNGLMAAPNLIALSLLSPLVFKATRDYVSHS